MQYNFAKGRICICRTSDKTSTVDAPEQAELSMGKSGSEIGRKNICKQAYVQDCEKEQRGNGCSSSITHSEA